MKTEIKPGCLVYVKTVSTANSPGVVERLLHKIGEAKERRLPSEDYLKAYFKGPFWLVIIPDSRGTWMDIPDCCAMAERDLVPLNDPTADVSKTQELELQT